MRFSEPMEELIQVRVARDEKRRLTQAARSLGMTLSEFLRTTVANVVSKEAA